MKLIKKSSLKIKKLNSRIAVIASNFNEEITNGLLAGAMAALKKNGVKEKNIKVIRVPGAFEIPVVLNKLCTLKGKKSFDGIITLGCVIKGETAHFEYISEAVSNSISMISAVHSKPVGFGVITCYTHDQAVARSESNSPDENNNKGYESALAVLKMIEVLESIK